VHSCLSFETVDGFLREGVRFLADGVARGERLVYVSGRSQDQMRRDVAVLSSPTELEAAGALTLMSYADVDDLDAVVVPERELGVFAAATAQAVTDGHRGLRVLAEVTGLAAEHDRRSRLLRYEHLATRYMSGHPMSALCGLDRSALDPEALAEFEAVHPHVRGPATSTGFRLLPDEDGLRLVGVVEAWDAARLGHLLRTLASPGSVVRLQLADLDSIGARGLCALAAYGQDLARSGGRLELVDPRPVVQRACSALRVDLLGRP
jgi:hypothetical protein